MSQATKTTEAFFANAARDAAEFGQNNLKAVAQSAEICFQGAQDLSRQILAFSTEWNNQAIAGAKALVGAKTLKEAADVQARFVRSAFERAASEAPRLQQAALVAAERAFAPLAERAKTAAAQIAVRPRAA